MGKQRQILMLSRYFLPSSHMMGIQFDAFFLIPLPFIFFLTGHNETELMVIGNRLSQQKLGHHIDVVYTTVVRVIQCSTLMRMDLDFCGYFEQQR